MTRQYNFIYKQLVKNDEKISGLNMVSRKNSTLRVSLLFYSDISYYSNKTRLDTVPKMYLESQHPFAPFIHLLKQYHFF